NDADLDPVIYEKDQRKQGTDFNVVNKIVAFVNNGKHASVLGKEIRDAMDKRLDQIRQSAYRKLNAKLFDEATAQRQVGDLIEYYWAAYPLSDPQDEIEYSLAREEVEALLAARKNSRDFAQVGWG